MKKRLLLPLSTLLLASVSLFAQETEKQPEKKEEKKVNSDSKVANRPIKRDNFLIDINYAGVVNAPTGVNFSFGYGNDIQIFYDHQFKAKVLSGAIGIGYSHAKYFNNGYTTNVDTATGLEYASFAPIKADSSYKRNSYTTNYFDVPAELRFRSKPNDKGHSWKVSVGFKAGFRLGSYSTTRTEEGRYSNFIQPLLTQTRYGITTRLGYGRIGLVGYYSLTRLFEAEKGHEILPFSIGFTISPF